MASGADARRQGVDDAESPVRPRILVVDDDSSVRRLVSEVLERGGYDVEEAGDAFGAVQSLELQRPQAVICDVRMPGLDGVSLLRLLRRGEERVPFLLISGDPSGRAQASELGDANGAFLGKPFTADALLAAVRDILPG